MKKLNDISSEKSFILKLKPAHCIYLKLFLFLSVSFCFCIQISAAENGKIIFLNNTGQPDGSFVYSLMEGEDLYIPFTIDSTVHGKNIKIYLTTFTGEQGDNITVVPGIIEKPELKPEGSSLSLLIDEPVLTLKLNTPELPTLGKYTGSLVVLNKNQILQTLPIILKRSTVQLLAQLSVDLKSVPINNTRSFFYLFDKPATFSVPLRNSSQDWQAKGIYLRLLEVKTPEGVNFTSAENLILRWNGKADINLWRSPSENSTDSLKRNILPNQQAELSGEFINLSPGEYTVKIGISAVNGNPENEQQIVFSIKARHNYFWAVSILIIALLISFIAHKFLSTQYSRSTLLKRIEIVRPPWLRAEANTLPVVSVRAILRQVEERNKNIFTALFSSEDVMNSRIEKVEKNIAVISHIRQIRERIDEWNVDKMISYRAEKILKKIIFYMGWEISDDKFLKELETRLEKLEAWFVPDQLYNRYWNDLKDDVENLLAQAKTEEFDKDEHKNIIGLLNKKISDQMAQLDKVSSDDLVKRQDIIVSIGHDYARLKILWECRINDDSKAEDKLFNMFKTNNPDSWPSIRKFWRMADDIIWKKLKEAAEYEKNEKSKVTDEDKNFKRLEFTSPENKIQTFFTNQLIHFKISPFPHSLGDTYLFRHGLNYHWTLFQEVENKREELATPVTKVPELVQYFPKVGRYKVAVKMFKDGDPADEILLKDVLNIQSSEDFGWKGIFRSAEITAVLLAALFALISGLSSFYFNNPVFGTVKDYISLFIWGAGVDLGKNFIQKLQQSTDGKNQ